MDREVVVSVVVITYGHEFVILDTLNSIIKQKGDFIIEIIISNDSSPDGTHAIVEKFIEEHKSNSRLRLKYFNHSINLGMIKNFDFALKQAEGDYIALCEGDDYWIVDSKLQMQIDFLENNLGTSLVCHDAEVNYTNITQKKHRFSNRRKSGWLSLEDILEKWIIPTASIVVRRDVVDNYPKWHDRIYSGDLTFAIMSKHMGDVYYINEIMSIYRVSYNGTSATSLLSKEKVGFVQDQHVLLLTLYNEETNFVYNEVLVNRIKALEKEKEFLVSLNESKIKTIFKFPVKSFSIVLNKLYRIIKSFFIY